jgi:hypothetical protein
MITPININMQPYPDTEFCGLPEIRIGYDNDPDYESAKNEMDSYARIIMDMQEMEYEVYPRMIFSELDSIHHIHNEYFVTETNFLRYIINHLTRTK